MTTPKLSLAPSTPEPERRVDPPPIETWPAPGDPLEVAYVLAENRTVDTIPTLQRWRESWWEYRAPCWVQVPDSSVRPWVYGELRDASYVAKDSNGDEVLKAWSPTRDKVNNVLDAYSAAAYLDEAVEPGTWLPTGETIPGVVTMPGGLFNVHTRQQSPATPKWLSTWSLPFDYDPQAAAPSAWLSFLSSIWPDDPDTITMLQEWLGYLVSGRTDLQKAMLLVGPRRSGKGTLLRTCTSLVGKVNTAAPTLAGMCTNFGLESVIGTALIAVGDARLGSGTSVLVERLLSIIGEDSMQVDRKYEKHWTGKIGARVMIASNEVPDFRDASGAIGSRFMIAKMTRSFYDREDTDLEAKLEAEMPGILAWALDGLDRLRANGRFTQSATSIEAREEMEESESPASQFVEAACVVSTEHTVPKDVLYRLWSDWAGRNGYASTNIATFERQLKATEPMVGGGRIRLDGVRTRVFNGIGVSKSWLGSSTFDSRITEGDVWRAAEPYAVPDL